MNETAIRDARVLGFPRMFILSLQHLFAMFGATVLVPILVNSFFQAATGQPLTKGLTVAVTLFFAGAGTLIFHFCTKRKVPVFLGSSFAFLGGFETVANLNTGIYAGMDANEKAAYACGGVVVAGLLYLVLATIIYFVGVKKVMRFLPPVVTGPVIICIGLGLAPSAASNFMTNWLLGLVAILTVIIFNIGGKGMFKIIPILMGVVISYIVAIIMNACGLTNVDGSAILNFATVSQASIIGAPQFGLCKFDLTSILAMAPISIATMMEHIGDVSAVSATTGENYIEDPGLHRTLTGDGLATAIAGLFGGPANTSYGENIATIAFSKVYDPRVIRGAAILSIALSFIPKISAIISTMPTAIIGGISFILYGMISAIGVRNVVENQVDLTNPRNLIIAGIIFVCALGFSDGLTFHIAGAPVTLTALALASIAGIVLNAILPGKDYEFGTSASGDQNQGIHITADKN